MKRSEKNLPLVDLAAALGSRGADAAGRSARHGDEVEFMQRVAQGEARAQRTLALRLVARVRRASHALMRGSVDAVDAAQHALIEIVRSAHIYHGGSTVECWADRITGRSIIRFARAVRRRNASLEPALRAGPLGSESENDSSESVPRDLEEYLSRLSPARREVLLLKHTFGHSIEEIAELTQAPPDTVQDHLLSARRDLRTLISRSSAFDVHMGAPAADPGGERWAIGRDCEAVGETMSEADLRELEVLERSDPTARAYAAQVRELERYLESADRPSTSDRDLAERAFSTVQVTTTRHMQTVDSDAYLAGAVDPEGPRWIRSGSIGMSLLMGVAAAVALALYEPPSMQLRRDVAGVAAPAVPAPTVEPLGSAHTAKRGARLKRAGALLPHRAALRVGDEVAAGDQAGCFVLEPATEVCLAAYASVRLANLALHNRVIEVLRGRVVASPREGQGSFVLSAGDVHASAVGTVFGVERAEDGVTSVRVRVLTGRVRVFSSAGTHEVFAMELGVVRSLERTATVGALSASAAQREWDLIAVGSPLKVPPAKRLTSARAQVAPSTSLTAASPVSAGAQAPEPASTSADP